MKNLLISELEFLDKKGYKPSTLEEIARELRSIGYKLDRGMDCKGLARHMTGERAGSSYPSLTTGVNEIDTGRSAFHFESRRDANFEKLQKMRQYVFAVVRGRIFTF